MEKRFPIPPFTMEAALQKMQSTEDAWSYDLLIKESDRKLK
jgi:nuclear transport factor 2 (NTF2) superfamily protein